MIQDFIEKLSEEETDLALHTKLCAQRYEQITQRFEVVDQKLDRIDVSIAEIREIMVSEKRNFNRMILSWAGSVIMMLVGVIAYLVKMHVL